jgi:uncharacterized repeat protein (TIGR01451 family)
MNKLNLITICFALLLPFISYSQGWEKTYDGGFNEEVNASDKTLDGGIIMAGVQKENVSGLQHAFLYKIDSLGNLVWEYYDQDHVATFVRIKDLINTSDGNYLLDIRFGNFTNALSPILQKISSNGTVLWEANLPTQYVNYVTNIAETADGGYIIIGPNNNSAGGTGVAKIDNNGNIVWEIQYVDSNHFVFPKDVMVTSNGDIILFTGLNDPIDPNTFIARLASDGSFIWQQEYNYGQYENHVAALELSTGDLVLAGVSAPNLSPDYVTLSKIDGDGNQIWFQLYYPAESHSVTGIQKTEDGGFVISGIENEFFAGGTDLYLLKVDSLGNEEWKNIYGRSKNEYSAGVFLGSNQSYYLTGSTQNSDDSIDAYLIKTDSLGFSLTNNLKGNLYYDENDDCQIQPSEIGIEQWLVKATQGNIEYLELTDTLGNYDFTLDTGTYLISAYPNTPYWGICNNNFNINFPTVFDTIVETNGVQALIECPLLDVSIGTPFLRRCFENRYTVQYCNYETIDAEDAYVEIEFDTAMTIINSSIPIASQMGNIYTFELGDVPWGNCENFTIDVMLGDTADCEAIPLGTTHCVEAHIYPDSICLPSGSWSGASVEVDANCSGDTISFFIQNVGTATTQSNLQYIVVEDDVILFDGNFTLNPMENEIIQIATNGSTFRLEAEQEPNHPGMSMPSITVEGCTVNNTTANLGFLNIFAQDDGDTFVDIDCRLNIGAYDPNDKMGFPLGYADENYINRGQDIEYQIRFQNTGTDTAFNIVVVDTLSEFLDITTVRPGASSHPYQFDISTGGELSFSFNNIMLPDSFINESASNGFVKFKVSQKSNLDLETQIQNSAAIYFDFNLPIFTNQTLHTIGENFVIVSIDTPFENSLAKVKVHPNPFSELVNFEIEGLEIKNGHFKLYDTLGRLLREQTFNNNTFTFQKKDLQAGIYFFTIEESGQLISNGKLIAQ